MYRRGAYPENPAWRCAAASGQPRRAQAPTVSARLPIPPPSPEASPADFLPLFVAQ
jgi:hypothetical protein